ncbi:MAG: cytochrome c biogenesis protein CcsA [Flavobacteriaceae bacterium]|nr:cytochrome c biogenesis protein CcsA [Flavobacteriaceae bacterium]
MNLLFFQNIFLVISCVWLFSLILILFKKNSIGVLFATIGTLLLLFFMVQLWVKLDRPPMRTLGETRLWYALFLPSIGLLIYAKWKYTWFLLYTVLMAWIFLFINYLHLENFSKTLMPALQSIWFIPHVLVYMIAYALLAASSLVAFKNLINSKKNQFIETIVLADQLVYVGFSFLTLGLLFGALWAKTAWGSYWTWDPKEVWAFLTWLAYLIYLHYRFFKPIEIKKANWMLVLALVILLLCWFWVNYSPIAKNSVHTYTNY